MKTIIQVVQHLTPGGIEVMALEMLRLKQKYTNMLIVSLEGEASAMLQQWPRLKPFKDKLVFLNKPPGYSLTTLDNLTKLIRQENPIAVHTHHIGPLLYGGIAARIAGVKNIVHTEHDAWHLQNKKRRFLEKQLLKLVKPTIVADSESVRVALEEYIPNTKTELILNGIDTDKFSPGDSKAARSALGLPLENIIIGCAGRLEKEKGQQVLIRALPYLANSISIALAGSGSQHASLAALCHDLEVDNRVVFLGHQDDMAQFYRALDVFCLPSFNEGMPLAPLEAQSCNIPSVLTDVGGCAESLCPNTGMLVPAGEPIEIANALIKCLSAKTSYSPRDFVVNNANARNMTNDYNTLCSARY